MTVLPCGLTTTVAAIETFDGVVAEAYPHMAVTVRLTDDLDVSRGDMICRPHNQPMVSQDVDAMICWLSASHTLRPGTMYGIKHTTRNATALVKGLTYRLDVNTLHRDEAAETLSLNEIGRITLRTTAPIFTDEYRRNRTTGSFLLIDEESGATVGACMVL